MPEKTADKNTKPEIRRRYRGIFDDRVVSSIGLDDGSCNHQCRHVRAVAHLDLDSLFLAVYQVKHFHVLVEDLLFRLFMDLIRPLAGGVKYRIL